MIIKDTKSDVLAQLTLESFRLNGLLLQKGDELAQDQDMSSARWQVLGTLILAGKPITVAEIARRMSLARQSVQRIADYLSERGFTRYIDNPDHRLWKLLAPTPAGRKVYRTLENRRRRWGEELAADVSVAELRAALAVLRKLRAATAPQVRRSGNKIKIG